MEIEKKYIELLKCNLEKEENFNLGEIKNEIIIYESSVKNWENYSGVPSLSGWKHPIYQYPNIHPIHKKIVDTISMLDVKNVCDVGAGAGSVAKYVYNSNNKLNISCIEGYDVHLNQMKENFNQDNTIISPQIKVNANIIKGISQKIPLEDNTQDLVYTCTVMMHIPYLLAIKSAIEIARISNKYILHLERKDGNVVIGNQISKLNFLQIDYKNLYENLGFKTIDYYEFPYPESENNLCVYYLGEKNI